MRKTASEILRNLELRIAQLEKQSAGKKLNKIPGVSQRALKEIVDDAFEGLLESATESYNGATWEANWKVKEVDSYGDVESAELISAHGYESDKSSVGFSTPRRLKDAQSRVALGQEIARQLRGTHIADVSLGWTNRYIDKVPVGDTFHIHSDEFYRHGNLGGNPNDVTKVRIKLKVKATYSKRDEEIYATWEWESI
tara:strand:- start:348 stop:938 length:591 start_codon:yes stop_codon:yes gene_type:complete